MKARPILFSGPMVRALLDGRKTQTRRIVKPQPIWVYDDIIPVKTNDADPKGAIKCPFGAVGDLLWGREAFAKCSDGSIHYAADGKLSFLRYSPSIHMPRWASRLTLEITDIRVEWLQDISDEDAKAEGAFFTDYGRDCFHRGYGDATTCPAPDEHHQQRRGWSCVETTSTNECLGSPKMAFANLWNKINGQDSWEANPWLWVITFKAINKNIDEVLREREYNAQTEMG